MIFGLSLGELATIGGVIVGVPGSIIGGYVKLLTHFGKAERSFRMTVVRQEARCRAENSKLRQDQMIMSGRVSQLEARLYIAEELGKVPREAAHAS